MQRACAAALVRKGVSVIHNPGISNDDKAALGIIQSLGARIEAFENKVIIDSCNYNNTPSIAGSINCGESGLSIRMFSPIVAMSDREITINGEGSLATRPMDFFDEVLPQLDVRVSSNNGKLPLKVKGPLQPRNIEIDGSLSSQFLTGLLMAYAASDADGATIMVKNLKSKPYIDLTLKVMNDFGLNVPQNNGYESFVFRKTNSKTSQTEVNYTVEGDWSGGAFLLVAGAIAGNITVRGLDVFSTQADKKILEALTDCGAVLSVQQSKIDIATHSNGLKAFQFDATDCPDLFPPLVALASGCKGTSVITGVSRLAHKESNRGLTLQEEFGKMEVSVTLQDDMMLVKGGEGLKGSTVHSRHDHRIAMACAVAALRADGVTIIEEADAINKSYPNFYEHIKSVGAEVSLQHTS